MKLLNCLRCDLERSVANIGFLGAAALTCILSFTATVFIDPSNDKLYSAFEALTLDKELLLSDNSFAAVSVFQKALSGYVTMFLPIIVAFPFMIAFCSERNSGHIRLTISRAGRIKYYLSKFLSAMIGGGASVMIGVFIYWIITAMLFPALSRYDISAEELAWILPNGYAAAVIRMFAAAFYYGAVSTLPALFFSSFCRDPYIITCLPFMLNYIRDTAVNRLMQAAFDRGDFEAGFGIQAYSSSAVTALTYSSEINDQLKTALILNTSLIAVMLIGFIFIMELRRDKGV